MWTDTDEKDAAMRSNLYGSPRRLPREWPVPELSRVWFVTLSRGSELARLNADLPPVLRTMEAAGETFPSAPTRTDPLAAENLNVGHLLSLGVAAVHSRPAGMNEMPAIKLYPEGITGPSGPSWSSLLRWVADTLASPRLETHRAKLARMDSEERHFVLG